MSLSISISNDDGKPFSPGSFVVGTVKLVMDEDQPIGEVTINFSGRANVLLIHSYGDMTTSRRDYKSVGHLFAQQLSLYQGIYTHRKGNYMWPFAFQIPLSVAPPLLPVGSRGMFRPEKPWKSDHIIELHPLPPSMVYSGPFICTVEYVLKATLTRPRASSGPLTLTRNLSCDKQVNVQSLTRRQDLETSCDWPYVNFQRNIECPIDSPPKCLPRCLCSSWRAGRRHLKSIISPKVELHLSVWVPKRINLGPKTALTVLVSAVAHKVGSETRVDQNDAAAVAKDQSQPPNYLTINEFKVSLLQHTQVRAGCHSSLSDNRILVRKGSSCLLPLSDDTDTSYSPGRPMGACERPPPATLNLADVTDLTVPTASTAVVPDFSTYNIARAHSLEVTLKMEYCNKRCTVKLRRIKLSLMSPECERLDSLSALLPQTQRSGPQNVSGIDDEWIVPPPATNNDDDDVVDSFFVDSPPRYTASETVG